MTSHRSKTSTEPVGSHYRSIVDREGAVFGFCGAGRVARALFWINRYDRKGRMKEGTNLEKINIHGLGLWADGDTNRLTTLFKPDSTGEDNPYTLTVQDSMQNSDDLISEGLSLHNLSSILENRKNHNNYSTTRVYRIFRTLEDGTLDLIQRIDWESPPASFNKVNYREWPLKCDFEDFKTVIFNDEPPEIDAIVVKCLAKGVMSKKLVKYLLKLFPKADWYISSKHGLPDWINLVSDSEKIKLLFLPPIPIGDLDEVPEWNIDMDEISYDAISYLDKIKDKYFQKDQNSYMVEMPHGLTVIALYYNNCALKHFNPQYDYLSGRIGKASVFFASLVSNILFDKGDFNQILCRTLSKTYAWRKNEEQRLIGGAEIQNIETNYGPDLLNNDNGIKEFQGNIKVFDWEKTKEVWDKSRDDLGVAYNEENEEFHFDIWRGQSIIEDYIALTETRRKAVTKLCKMSKAHINTQTIPIASTSCMIIDEPGRGKTTLVRSLAAKLGINFLPFNITDMVEKKDIIKCFDEIANTQASNRNEIIMVFIDDINAKLDSENVYKYFLSPLEDGVYKRSGMRCSIDPCIWVFAGTRGENLKQADKFPDFNSRLSHGIINLINDNPSQQETDLQRLEQVYIAISKLRNVYKDLRYIYLNVLLFFYRLKPERVSMRKIINYVNNFDDVQNATIHERNFPKSTDLKFKKDDIDETIKLKDVTKTFKNSSPSSETKIRLY